MGEPVVDVPAKLSARARVSSTAQGRKTHPVDAHSVALVGLRSQGLRTITADDATVALRLLIDRREQLGVTRVQVMEPDPLSRTPVSGKPGQAPFGSR
jgi:hypothetical protein